MWHSVNVASGLPISRPKRIKWHLTKTLGSLGFYISWFYFDPWLRLPVAWKRKRVFSWGFQWKNTAWMPFHIILGHMKYVQFIHFHQIYHFFLISSGKTKFSMASCRFINGFKSILYKNQCFEPIYKPIKVAVDIFTLFSHFTKNFDPHEGLEGH